MRLLSKLAHLVGKLDSVGQKSDTAGVADKASAALASDLNVVENPKMADFEALQEGDVLLSSREGSSREVIANRPDKKMLHVRIKRNTVVNGTSLPPFLRNAGDTVAMIKKEVEELPPGTIVYMRKGKVDEEYVAITLHSVQPRAHMDDPVQGEYSYEDVLSYGGNIAKIATKIIKKPKKS